MSRCYTSGTWEDPSATPHVKPGPGQVERAPRATTLIKRMPRDQALGGPPHSPSLSAPERNRTSTPGSGGLCDIHFTTGAQVGDAAITAVCARPPSAGAQEASSAVTGRP